MKLNLLLLFQIAHSPHNAIYVHVFICNLKPAMVQIFPRLLKSTPSSNCKDHPRYSCQTIEDSNPKPSIIALRVIVKWNFIWKAHWEPLCTQARPKSKANFTNLHKILRRCCSATLSCSSWPTISRSQDTWLQSRWASNPFDHASVVLFQRRCSCCVPIWINSNSSSLRQILDPQQFPRRTPQLSCCTIVSELNMLGALPNKNLHTSPDVNCVTIRNSKLINFWLRALPYA